MKQQLPGLFSRNWLIKQPPALFDTPHSVTHANCKKINTPIIAAKAISVSVASPETVQHKKAHQIKQRS
jgi:hypothetical protein